MYVVYTCKVNNTYNIRDAHDLYQAHRYAFDQRNRRQLLQDWRRWELIEPMYDGVNVAFWRQAMFLTRGDSGD